MRSRAFRFVCLAAMIAAAPARAIVGPANEHGPLESRVVMVLTRLAGASAFCSGVVLAPDAVLTAAHCVNDAANSVIFFRDEAGAPTTRAIAAVAPHPEYRGDAIAKRVRSIDLALVSLASPLPARFQPTALAQGGDIAVGQKFRVAGYGLGRENAGSTGGVFRWAVIAAREPLSRVLLWAEDPGHGGLGACTGDSGGPVFANDSDVVVAISDWSTGPTKRTRCGGLTQGALVAPQRGWIDGVLRGWAR